MFVESIKALYAKIENLESDNGQLKTQNQALKEKAEAQSLEQNKKMQALLERVEELEKKSEKSSSSTLTAGAK
jgi:predicted RNase H-like nuclease (RuvC/YqgF family)